MKTLKEQIAIMQAADNGEEIQFRNLESEPWLTATVRVFDWATYDYQVLSKPKDIWANEYPMVAGIKIYGYSNPSDALANAGAFAVRKAVRYREVIE